MGFLRKHLFRSKGSPLEEKNYFLVKFFLSSESSSKPFFHHFLKTFEKKIFFVRFFFAFGPRLEKNVFLTEKNLSPQSC